VPTTDEANDLYARLLAANADAMAVHLYEVAYHALAAALHAAEPLEDPERFDAVERLAGRQQELINHQAPDHRLATRSAGERGHAGLFPTLAAQARAKALMARKPRA
jgi:hypothetical protein